jgi:hypothetical protein
MDGEAMKQQKAAKISPHHMTAHVLTFKPRDPAIAARLSEESIRVAWLFQHASTATREKLFAAIRETPCECLGCLGLRGGVR